MERFCGGCGAALERRAAESHLAAAVPARSPEKERRQVTVLFADVVGFTSLSERLDPEVVHEMMDGCFALLAREVDRFGGRINAFTGDGVMALFGTPLAEEDHAVRAMHASLAIQAGMETYGSDVERISGAEFRLRIGVNTGLVVVGGMHEGGLDDGGSVEYTALGDTVNLAARLESAARPGGVLAGEATHRAARDAFRWQPVGPLQLKGKSEPVPAWKPVAACGSQSRFETLAQRGLTRFVGRRTEFDALVDAWERAARGTGQVVSVVGEAGLGKSRLLHEFKTEMAKREVALFEGSCFTYGDSTSYLPFLQILRALLDVGMAPTAATDDIGALVDSRLSRLGLARCSSYLRHLLGLDPGDDRLALQLPATIRQRTSEALCLVTLATASERPAVLVVEDVHWIDKASEEVLSLVVEAMSETPLLVVLVYRPEYLHAWGEVAYHAEVSLDRLGGASSAAMVRAILGKSYARNVALARLSAEDSRTMTRQLLGAAAVPHELEDLIETSTEGNPLFIEELIRDLIESGQLVHSGGGAYRLAGPAAPLALPTTLEGVLLARVDRLNPELKSLLQVASVLGRVFPYRLVKAVSNLDADRGLERALLQLEDLDFVYQSALAPERQYSFKHVLTQEAIYQTLARKRREAHHERAGQAIEALYGDRLDEWVEILAHHYTRSGDGAKALDYLALAHHKANRSFALLEAKGFFDEAMNILDRGPATPDNDHRRISFLADQMLVAFFLNQTRACLELASRYQEVADRVDDLGVRGMFYERIGMCFTAMGHLAEGIAKLNLAAATCEAGGNIAGAGVAYAMLGWAHFWAANYQDVRTYRTKALSALRVDFEPLHAMWARTSAAWASAQRGAWAEAVEDGEAALREANEQANDSLISFSNMSLCVVYTGRGQLEEALRCGELARQQAPTPAEELWAISALGQTWCRTGRAGQAVEALAAAAPLYDASEFLGTRLWNLTNLGEAYWRAGRLEEAAKTLETVVVLGQQHGTRFYLGSALRLLGEVTRESGAFERSLAVLSEIGAENEQALAHAGYGRLRHERGDRDGARRHLTAALEIFERIGTLGEPHLVRQTLVALDNAS